MKEGKKENENERKDNEWGPATTGSNRAYNPSYIKAPMWGHVAREIKWGDSETSAAVSDSNACLLVGPRTNSQTSLCHTLLENAHGHACIYLKHSLED